MKRLSLLLGLFASAMGMAAQTELSTITITYDNDQATVSIPAEAAGDVTCSTGTSSNVLINSSTSSTEYCYKVLGTTANGSLTINGAYKLTLEMAGVNITSNNGAAINVNSAKRIAVVLDEGTTNTLVDEEGGDHKAALYFTGHPEFKGKGTLNVTGRTGHAIAAKDYLELKSEMGEINILSAVKDGIHCGRGKKGKADNYFEINGGVVNISNVGSDCIDSDDYGCMKIKGGTLNLTVNTDKGSGIKCDSIFNMKDGQVNINLTATDAEGIRCNYEANFKGGDINITNSGTGSKGIKLKNEEVYSDKVKVINGGYANFSGTDVDITLSGATYVTLKDASRCMGISVDKDMTLSGGEIAIHRNSNEVKSHNIKGTLTISETGTLFLDGNHYVPTIAYPAQMAIYAKVQLKGEEISDFANLHLAAYQGDECRGNASFTLLKDGYAYAQMQVYGNEGDKVDFRLYDASEDTEVKSTTTIEIVDNATVGTPSEPTTIEFGATVTPGDIDGNDEVTMTDLAALIALLNGVDNASFNQQAADLDNSGSLDLEDVKLMVDMLMKQP